MGDPNIISELLLIVTAAAVAVGIQGMPQNTQQTASFLLANQNQLCRG